MADSDGILTNLEVNCSYAKILAMPISSPPAVCVFSITEDKGLCQIPSNANFSPPAVCVFSITEDKGLWKRSTRARRLLRLIGLEHCLGEGSYPELWMWVLASLSSALSICNPVFTGIIECQCARLISRSSPALHKSASCDSGTNSHLFRFGCATLMIGVGTSRLDLRTGGFCSGLG